MAKNQFRILIWLWVWTITLVAGALWAHGIPYCRNLISPQIFERMQLPPVSYDSGLFKWVLMSFDLEGIKQRLRSGRPVDLFVLSKLNSSIGSLNQINKESFSSSVTQLLDQEDLIKYRPISTVLGTRSVTQESHLTGAENEISLTPNELRRLNANTLSSSYPVEFEQIPPQSIQLLSAPRQSLGFLDIKLRFRAEREEFEGILFQTADRNRGIRLQLARTLAQTTALKVVVGSGWISGQGLGLGPAHELVLTTDLDPNQDHEVELRLKSWGDLSAKLDGIYIGKIDNCKPMLDNLVLGNGYDGYQPFIGKINLEKLELSTLKENAVSQSVDLGLMFWLGLALAVGHTLALYHLLRYLFPTA